MTTESIKEKPFWLNPPWNILFDIFKLQRVKPWDVNISKLLDTMIMEMESRGRIDFAASGMALFSSATLYRIKSDLILKLEEPPEVEYERENVYLPPPIQLPYRHEYTTTTINDLIDALERAIKSEMQLKTTMDTSESKLEPFYPEASIIESIDKFMIDVKDEVDKLHQRILRLAKEGKPVLFSKLTSGQKKIETIRTFFLVLFMACNEMIKLWQNTEFSEIYITVDEAVDLEGSENTIG